MNILTVIAHPEFQAGAKWAQPANLVVDDLTTWKGWGLTLLDKTWLVKTTYQIGLSHQLLWHPTIIELQFNWVLHTPFAIAHD